METDGHQCLRAHFHDECTLKPKCISDEMILQDTYVGSHTCFHIELKECSSMVYWKIHSVP